MISPFTKSLEVGSILRQPLLFISPQLFPKIACGIKTFYYFCKNFILKPMNDNTKYHPRISTSLFSKCKLLAALLAMTLIAASCEKPVFDDEGSSKKEDQKETSAKNDQTVNKGKGDNGGWANDEKDEDMDGEEWQDGDTVNVATFKSRDFDEAVWVKGYIVGCATTTGGYKYSFTQPFESMTSILIADSKKEDNKKNVVAIQLKSGSDIRADLNLVENPENYRRAVAVYGYKTTYLRIDGMKEILDYELKR